MLTAHTSGSIAELVQGRLVGPPDVPITNLAALDQAGPGALTFIRDRKFAPRWAESKATTALATEGLSVPQTGQDRRAVIYVADADLAMVKVLALFEVRPTLPPRGVHPTAVVDPAAKIPASARIGPHCIVGPGAEFGEECTLIARVTIGAGVKIGPGSLLHPGVVIYDRCTLGAQVILHANVVIGADGFGYRPDPAGRGVIKIPHAGSVHIGNGVEVGACACIDRGKFGPTMVGDGSKIDNLVQIAHNCRIGRSVLICGMAGMAGSVTVGDGAIIGGAVGITDGVAIGAGARIGAKSAVMSDVPPGATYLGMPAGPHQEQLRSWSAVRKLPAVLKDLRRPAKADTANGPMPGAGV